MMRRAFLPRLVAVAAAAASLSACGGGTDDLYAYIDDVKGRPGGRPEPLPQIQPAPTYVYEAGTRRSPFMPDAPTRRVSNNPNAVQGPDPNRPPEILEQFPLDSLSMVGTMSNQRASYGLVQASDGLVHRVTVGDHMGQNYGRIVSITESEIRLVEIISDGLGGYLERPAAIGLTD